MRPTPPEPWTLAGLLPPNPGPPKLTAAFLAAGLVDVAYVLEPSPLGDLLLAATGRGLVRVAYVEDREDALLSDLARRISPRVVVAPARLDPVRDQLEQYFSRRRAAFDLALDLRLLRPGFSRRVLDVTAQIPFGAVSSYRRIADAAGSPRAFRAAGSALGANPLPVVIPCHRVLTSAGGLGGYTGGTERKAYLLELERGHPI